MLDGHSGRRTLSHGLNNGFSVLGAIVVEPRAVGEESDVLREVQRESNDDHAEEEEEEGV